MSDEGPGSITPGPKASLVILSLIRLKQGGPGILPAKVPKRGPSEFGRRRPLTIRLVRDSGRPDVGHRTVRAVTRRFRFRVQRRERERLRRRERVRHNGLKNLGSTILEGWMRGIGGVASSVNRILSSLSLLILARAKKLKNRFREDTRAGTTTRGRGYLGLLRRLTGKNFALGQSDFTLVVRDERSSTLLRGGY